MKTFIHEDFLLHSSIGRILYHEAAESLPIIDFHNHLNPKAIAENCSFSTITEAWLKNDHYKWRAMRANGVPEELVTGLGADWDKFSAWASTVQNAFGNPLYHWTHLELARYFGFYGTLSAATAQSVWEQCNARLTAPDFTAKALLEKQSVEVLCTTDDPLDSLEYHIQIQNENSSIAVYPSFRPEKALSVDKAEFAAYVSSLGEKFGKQISALSDFVELLLERLDFFCSLGCKASDHSLEGVFYLPCIFEQADAIFKRAINGIVPTADECAQYRGFLLVELGKEYAKRGLVMQLHIGALRNNSTKIFRDFGADAGCDSINDFAYAPQLSKLLDEMDKAELLPKTILYYLNPKDAEMLASMAGNFQSNSNGCKSKVQLGSAWWFCDHKTGMERQLETLAHTGLLSAFVGMLTDSRSLLSFPRHEYFRRVLCEFIGQRVDMGEYPPDMDHLKQMVENICYHNAKNYFGL